MSFLQLKQDADNAKKVLVKKQNELALLLAESDLRNKRERLGDALRSSLHPSNLFVAMWIALGIWFALCVATFVFVVSKSWKAAFVLGLLTSAFGFVVTVSSACFWRERDLRDFVEWYEHAQQLVTDETLSETTSVVAS